MKSLERISLALVLCFTLLAAVWLHSNLSRYEVFLYPDSSFTAIRYDHITGRTWIIAPTQAPIELGMKGKPTIEELRNR